MNNLDHRSPLARPDRTLTSALAEASRAFLWWVGIVGAALTTFANFEKVMSFSRVMRELTLAVTALSSTFVNFVLSFVNVQLPDDLALVAVACLCVSMIMIGSLLKSDDATRYGQYRVYSPDRALNHYVGMPLAILILTVVLTLSTPYWQTPFVVGAWGLVGFIVMHWQRRRRFRVSFDVRRRVFWSTWLFVCVVGALTLLPLFGTVTQDGRVPYPTGLVILGGVVYAVLDNLGNRVAHRVIVVRMIWVLVGLVFLMSFNGIALLYEAR